MPSRKACNFGSNCTATHEMLPQIAQDNKSLYSLLDIHRLEYQRDLCKYFCEFRKHGKGAIEQRILEHVRQLSDRFACP